MGRRERLKSLLPLRIKSDNLIAYSLELSLFIPVPRRSLDIRFGVSFGFTNLGGPGGSVQGLLAAQFTLKRDFIT